MTTPPVPIDASANVPQDLTRNLRRLEETDFDFNDSDTGYLTHGLHPYPAKYIPQIPNALIQELSLAGDTVADVFCGSGTTLVEALLLDRNAIGFDANPLACLITEAKTTRFGPADRQPLLSLSDRTDQYAEMIAGAGTNLFANRGPFQSSAARPTNPALDFWFEPFVIEELAEILSLSRKMPSEATRTVSLVALSSIIVAVSRQDSDTRYVRRQKKIHPGETMLRFTRALRSAISNVQEFGNRIAPNLSREVHHANILAAPESRCFDLMVCSPPYPNAYSYHLYHMTRMIWLGMDQPKFKREEIGSHRKYSRKGPNGATAYTFRAEMGTIFAWLHRHLKLGGFACFVVGDSTIKGQLVDNADLISEVAETHHFKEVMRRTRRLQITKKAFNPVIGKIKDEKILMLENHRGNT